jgi:NMD protein affecting ribosome stability and mRNA decay
MCEGCYSSWAKFKNPDYAEKFCHDCGKPNKTSLRKPVCLSCYKASKA